MAPLSLRLLGGLALADDGEALHLTMRGQRLVAFFALHRAASRTGVSAALWPDLGERQALASLRTLVWRVHKVCPALLRADGHELELGARVRVDVDDLAALATEFARTPSLRATDVSRIVAHTGTLCAGVLLPGWDEDWVVGERHHLEQLRLHTLEACVRRLLTAGEVELALSLALEAVRSEPLRETATACLMAVYVAEGNMSDALREYQAFRWLLRQELGIAPTERLASVLPRQVRAAAVDHPGATSAYRL